jgi:hypothetical protein
MFGVEVNVREEWPEGISREKCPSTLVLPHAYMYPDGSTPQRDQFSCRITSSLLGKAQLKQNVPTMRSTFLEELHLQMTRKLILIKTA